MDNLLALNKKYDVVYADPPWTFKSYSEKGEGKSAQNHYGCMTMKDIENLPVNEITSENSILFLWVTDPLLPKQISVMEKWGFTYKTMGFVWTKLNPKSKTPFIGCGYYTRSNEEYCLIGTKGKPGRPKNKSISQSVQSVIREHSRKPDEIRTYIEMLYPDANRIELFARTQYPGWDVFGNQVDKFEPETRITTLYD